MAAGREPQRESGRLACVLLWPRPTLPTLHRSTSLFLMRNTDKAFIARGTLLSSSASSRPAAIRRASARAVHLRHHGGHGER